MSVAVRAYDVVDINRVSASSALAIIHKLTLLEEDLKLLFIAVDPEHRWPQQYVCNKAE